MLLFGKKKRIVEKIMGISLSISHPLIYPLKSTHKTDNERGLQKYFARNCIYQIESAIILFYFRFIDSATTKKWKENSANTRNPNQIKCESQLTISIYIS